VLAVKRSQYVKRNKWERESKSQRPGRAAFFPLPKSTPELRIKAATANIEAGDSAIASITSGDKLSPMIGRGMIWSGHCDFASWMCQPKRFGFALHCASFHDITLAQTLAQS